jgi:hypothetical protein
MNALLWTLSIVLAAIYAITGTSRLVASRERLLAVPGMGWVERTLMSRVRTIGALERHCSRPRLRRFACSRRRGRG